MDLLNSTIKELLVKSDDLEVETNQTEIDFIQAVFVETHDGEVMEDIFDSIWFKIVAIVCYIVILLSSGLMLAFAEYEKLYHGHFRTLTNQLLSNLYVIVC